MNFLVLASTNGADDFCVAYCFFAPYCIGALGYGACCNFLTPISLAHTLCSLNHHQQALRSMLTTLQIRYDIFSESRTWFPTCNLNVNSWGRVTQATWYRMYLRTVIVGRYVCYDVMYITRQCTKRYGEELRIFSLLERTSSCKIVPRVARPIITSSVARTS